MARAQDCRGLQSPGHCHSDKYPLHAGLWVHFELVLPDPHHPPALASKTPEVPGIPSASGLDLGFPRLRQLVAPHGETPTVPEIPIHEHGNAPFTEDEIRTTRQVGRMLLPGQADLDQQGSQTPLRSGALAADAAHDTAARLRGHDVAAMAAWPCRFLGFPNLACYGRWPCRQSCYC